MRKNGKLEEVSWSRGARRPWPQKFNETLAAGGSFGVIGSNHTTNEENYYLQKFAREVLGTSNIDHHRTGDVATLLDALSGKTGKLATVADLYERKAVLVLGADLALEHPLLSFQMRANYRHHQAHVYARDAGAGARGQVRGGRASAAPAPPADVSFAGAANQPARQAEGRAGAGRSCSTTAFKGATSASWWSSANRWASR